MTFVALALFGIGLADGLRALLRRGASVAGAVVWVALVAVAIAADLGGASDLPWWLASLAPVVGVLWWSAIPVAPGDGLRARAPRRWVLLACVAVACAGSALSMLLGSPPAVGAAPRLDVRSVLVVLGTGVFLIVSANALVRSALRSAERDDPDEQTAVLPSPAPALRGGRWIGPLERLTLTALLIAGAYPVAAALIAAKGIVRFPEIQADRRMGARAEYFLVGSFVSWAIAIGGAGIVRLGIG